MSAGGFDADWLVVIFLAAAAIAIFLVFVRARPATRTTATIRSKTFRAPHSYRPFAHGPASRGFRVMAPIQVAASYVLELQADGQSEFMRASVNEVLAEELKVGERVSITYIVRGIPGIWSRVYVTTITPLKVATEPV